MVRLPLCLCPHTAAHLQVLQVDLDRAHSLGLLAELHPADAGELGQARDDVELAVDDLAHPVLGAHQQRHVRFPVLLL